MFSFFSQIESQSSQSHRGHNRRGHFVCAPLGIIGRVLFPTNVMADFDGVSLAELKVKVAVTSKTFSYLFTLKAVVIGEFTPFSVMEAVQNNF